MSLRHWMFYFCAVCIFTTGEIVLADEVTMKNGDRLTGTVVGLKEGTLVFTTSYAGDISIQWKEILSIRTDTPVQIVLGDETSARGLLLPGKGEKLHLQTEQIEGGLTVPMAGVAAINPPPPGPAVKVKARINAGVHVKKGNTDTEAYHIDGEFGARTAQNRYTIGGAMNREENSDRKTADNARLYMGYDHFVTEKWFFYTNADFEKDDFKDLKLRTILGGGTGYQFLEKEQTNLFFKIGAAYVNEDYETSVNDEDYAAGRWSLHYDRYFFDRFMQFFHGHDGLVSLDNAEDMVIQTKTGLRFPLKKGFNTTVEYHWDWDNTPSEGKDRVDERYLFTLGYSWE